MTTEEIMNDFNRSAERKVANAIYETELLPKLLATEKGKILVLDVKSRDYAIGADLLEADSLLRELHPDAFTHAFRIGYRTAGSLGGRMREIQT